MTLPVILQAPEISKIPLYPQDVSAGGFGVLISEGPDHGKTFECSVRVGDKVFNSCKAFIAWSYDKKDGTWNAGIAIKEFPEDRDEFQAFLEEIHRNA